MFHKIKEHKCIFIILIISGIFCLDLFIRNGRPSTFDGPTHLTNIAQFAAALRSFEFPVRWMDGFANYGMPMPIIVQQTTAYLGAFFVLLTQNVVVSYNLVVFIGTFLSLFFLFQFLKLHFSENAALFAVILFNFAPYRIINIYVRGALPEFFAHVFFPLIFLGLYYWINKRSEKGLIYLLIGLVGILFTHPFTLIIGSILFIPYSVWLLYQKKQNVLQPSFIIPLIFVVLLSFGVTAYYIIPLLSEIKYFYYGQSGAGIKPDQHLTFLNYIGDYWYYFTKNDIDVRGHVIHLGLIELTVIILGVILSFFKSKRNQFLVWVYVSLLLLVFFTTQYATYLYEAIPVLGGIQYNWRMFAGIIFIAPIVAAYIFDTTKSKQLFFFVILLVLISRIPQLYGKNYLIEPESKYYFTKENMHGVVLNTIWTGKAEDYPVKKIKGEIIEGRGVITNRTLSNSWRKYEIDAKESIRMSDNTFYFPGWKVYIDEKNTEIEFQDMNYRGVITYRVPAGKHTVRVQFENTKIRLLSNMISIISILLCLGWVFFRNIPNRQTRKPVNPLTR